MNSELESAALAECRAQRLAGKKPTVRSVREAIGKGSHADLGPLVKQFNEQEPTAMPDELSSLLIASGEKIWNHAQSSFAKTIAAMHAAVSAEREEAEEEKRAIREELDVASRAGEQAKQKIAELEQELMEARKLPAQLLKAHQQQMKRMNAEELRLVSKIDALQCQHEENLARIAELQGRLASLAEWRAAAVSNSSDADHSS